MYVKMLSMVTHTQSLSKMLNPPTLESPDIEPFKAVFPKGDVQHIKKKISFVGIHCVLTERVLCQDDVHILFQFKKTLHSHSIAL